jgi:Kdo2-lipid IVA lauroyltransferase/acyltransferase
MGTTTTHPRRDQAVFLALKAVLGLGGRLPLGLMRPLGAGLGRVALRLGTRDRGRARAHLRIAFPELSEEAIQRLLTASARHLGLMVAEVSWLWRASAHKVRALCSMEGIEHLQAALERGRGAVLVTGHCGNWELLNACLGAWDVPMTIAVRGLRDTRIDAVSTALRRRFGGEVVPRGPEAGRRLARAVLANRVAGLLIDQDIRDVPGVFVSFFGRPAWTPSGAATLALRLDCPVVPAFIHRRKDQTHHAVVHPPLELPAEGPKEDRVVAVTAAATAAIERQIRAHPEQWVWMHRRWRTRPDDEEG